MPMFTEIDPWRDEDFWPKAIGEDDQRDYEEEEFNRRLMEEENPAYGPGNPDWERDFALDQPGEGATPGPIDCTPEKRGAGSSAPQRGRFPAPPSPCSCRTGARCMDCIERDGLTRRVLA